MPECRGRTGRCFRPAFVSWPVQPVGTPMSQNDPISEVFREDVDLVSPPDFFLRLNTLVEDPTVPIQSIADLIAQDPAVTARLLRIANSPVYGHAGQIDSIARSIATIGTRGLRDLVLATSAVEAFSAIESRDFDWHGFWYHSLLTAGLARLLGRRARLPCTEPLFVAGLLHDIGLPIIARHETGLAARLGDHCHRGEALQGIEDSLGYDHAELARRLFERWSMPERILEAVACHHDAGRAEHYPREAAIVQIADLAASERLDALPEELWLVVGLSQRDLEYLMPEALDQVEALFGLFVSEAA